MGKPSLRSRLRAAERQREYAETALIILEGCVHAGCGQELLRVFKDNPRFNLPMAYEVMLAGMLCGFLRRGHGEAGVG